MNILAWNLVISPMCQTHIMETRFNHVGGLGACWLRYNYRKHRFVEPRDRRSLSHAHSAWLDELVIVDFPTDDWLPNDTRNVESLGNMVWRISVFISEWLFSVHCLHSLEPV